MTPESNLDYQKLAQFLREIDKCDRELDTLKGEHMQRCGAVRKRKSSWFDQIAKAGFDLAAIKFNLKEDKLRDALEAHRHGAEADILADADRIRGELGAFADTPLGAAVVAQAEAAQAQAISKPRGRGRGRKAGPDMSAESKADALNVGVDDDEREAARKAEAEERLAAIKPLGVDPQTVN